MEALDRQIARLEIVSQGYWYAWKLFGQKRYLDAYKQVNIRIRKLKGDYQGVK